jgi:hypothetical protein
MNDLYKLYKIKILDKYSKYFSMFCNNNSLDVLPDHVLEQYNEDLELAKLEKDNIDKIFNYSDAFLKKQKIFDNLQPAKINKISYKVFKELEKNETLISNLNSFKPIKGYSKVVEYDQIKTISGRLVSKQYSPRILTLPARHRKIFESRWTKEGDLLQVDFKSLEPRVIRKINKKESSEDIYMDIANELDFKVDRLIVKRAIISILYGSNTQISGLSKERSNVVLETTKNYFNIERILEIAQKRSDVDCRMNFYGRPIWNIKEEKTNKIVNNYIQSTAVDISLLYFSELCEKLDMDFCKPIFVIHDALICDVHKKYKNEFLKVVKSGFNCSKLGNFPVEITNILEVLYE